MEPLVALRNAIGVVAPIALGVAVGKPMAGVAAGFGALQFPTPTTRGLIACALGECWRQPCCALSR